MDQSLDLKTELKEIEKKKLELEKQIQDQQNQSRLQQVKDKLEGSVVCYFEKRKGEQASIYITYYKEFYLKQDSINFTGEEVRVHKNLYTDRWTTEITIIKKDSRHSSFNEQDLFGVRNKTISKELFEHIKTSIKGVASNLISLIEETIEPKFLVTVGESSDTKSIVSQASQLDIPYTLLSQEEGWLISNSPYFNQGIWYLTKGSLEWLEKRYQQELETDSSYSAACASVGERYRNGRAYKYAALLEKLKQEYNGSHRRI